jgi:glycosyltransferase involved in cell wall biosynthesis
VITANVTSMPEIAGDAALLVDPFNPESIALAMYKIYQYETIRKELIQRGNQRKDLFTWQKSADLLWDSMLKAFNTPEP